MNLKIYLQDIEIQNKVNDIHKQMFLNRFIIIKLLNKLNDNEKKMKIMKEN